MYGHGIVVQQAGCRQESREGHKRVFRPAKANKLRPEIPRDRDLRHRRSKPRTSRDTAASRRGATARHRLHRRGRCSR